MRYRFGNVIRKRRAALGLTQAGLAERSGFDRIYINELENGASNPTLNTLAKLAATLQVPISDLVHEAEITVDESFFSG